jgi:hypothetical protein
MPSMKSIAILAIAGAAACSDSTSPGVGQPISVSFSTASTTGASLSRSAELTASADALVINKVQLVVSRVELVPVGAVCTSEAVAGDDDDDSECAELELAPSVLDLPVDGTVASKLAVTVPAGAYTAFEAKIRPVRADGSHGRGSAAFLAANPTFGNVSVRVEGTFNGTPFTYTGAPDFGLETRFDPPLTVDAAPLNLTIHVDLASWFRSSTGATIDPSTANAGGANAGVVSDNIRRSFRGFRDDDRNGHDDHEDGPNHG